MRSRPYCRRRAGGRTGTTVRFWPDPGFFDTPNISVPRPRSGDPEAAIDLDGDAIAIETADGESLEAEAPGGVAGSFLLSMFRSGGLQHGKGQLPLYI